MKLDPKAILEKGRTDLRYFIETAFQIVNKDSKLVPLLFNAPQNDYWPNITPRDIILKARKEGFSTIRLARMIAKCATRKYRKCVVVSHEGKATERLLERAHHLVDTSLICIRTETKSAHKITFPDTESSIWIGTAGQKAFGRGDDISDFLASELAYWEDPGILTGIEEACITDAEGCIESTANGWGTPHHNLWKRAKEGKGVLAIGDGTMRFYAPHFFAWFRDPGYVMPGDRPLEGLDEYEKSLRDDFGVTDAQLRWRRAKIASMSEPELFCQEYPATPEESFLVSGLMVFNSAALDKMEKAARPILWKGEIRDVGGKTQLDIGEHGRLSIWATPREGSEYVVSADVSAGIAGEAYSVADVWDRTTWEQVGQWRGYIPPDEFGDLLIMLGSFYNWAFLAPEVNNHGLVTCCRIRDKDYPNYLVRDTSIGGTDLGWYTSPGESGTRTEVIDAMRAAIKDFLCKINSPVTFSECRSFVRLKNGKLGPQPGSYSDSVFSGAIGIKMLEDMGYKPEAGFAGFQSRLGLAHRKGSGKVVRPSYKRGYV